MKIGNADELGDAAPIHFNAKSRRLRSRKDRQNYRRFTVMLFPFAPLLSLRLCVEEENDRTASPRYAVESPC